MKIRRIFVYTKRSNLVIFNPRRKIMFFTTGNVVLSLERVLRILQVEFQVALLFGSIKGGEGDLAAKLLYSIVQ